MSDNAADEKICEQSQPWSSLQGYPSGTLSYPKPETDYGEIIRNSQLFWSKLEQFSALLLTNFRIPLVAGTPLDLHRLFVEVTSRGGIEKVIRERKWGEVKRIFRFPSSVTNASFVLRKHYLSKLYHFEKVYYFRKAEPSVSLADIDPTNRNVSVDDDSAATNLEDGNVVVGTIDAKFDAGYVISVNMGSENLKGVLYHKPASPHQVNTMVRSSQRIRKRQLTLKDPSRPL